MSLVRLWQDSVIVSTWDPAAGEPLEPGEILVCVATNPSYASYFLVASGVVTDIGGALKHVFSGGIHYRPTTQIDAHLRVRHFGDFPLDGGVQAEGSTMMNLRLGYQATENLHLNLDMLNILDSNDHDVEYFYESQLPWETMPVEDRHYHVFEPRSFRLYATYRL